MRSLHSSSENCLLLDRSPALAVLVAGAPGTAQILARTLSDAELLAVTELLSITAPGSGLGEEPDAMVTLRMGRIGLDGAAVTLLAVPDEERLWFRWEELLTAADAALVVADPQDPAGSLATIEYLHRRGIPLAVVIDQSSTSWPGTTADVRQALRLADPRVPLVAADITERGAALRSLVALVEHADACAAATRPLRLRSREPDRGAPRPTTEPFTSRS
ncbi:ATP/GTP-binding protein [Kitasatospora nipponensis]|uniref:ATP/GTP-binding protein n=1 Tax=Kitasatospora nipponensis TaxID=258049 RepID=A0ABN1W5E6_9ACTN